MSYCPYCGGEVQKIENFCVSCGEKLPSDLRERKISEKPSKKWWFLPIIFLFVSGITVFTVYFYTNFQTNKAIANFDEAKEMALIGDFNQAEELLKSAIAHKDNFDAAEDVLEFIEIAKDSEENFKEIEKQNKDNHFSDSYQTIRKIEHNLQKYNGDLVNQVADKTMNIKNLTLLREATYKLNNEPTLSTLKSLIWEMEDNSHEQAPEVKEEIYQKLISKTYETSTDLLDDLQFTQALQLIDDTLSVIESSEQLESLKATINKEKTAFESAQEQRFEQALSVFEEEQELNENNAIELIDINLQGNETNWVINGELKSKGTVPVHSILVKYSIIDSNEKQLIENSVYVFPETLYPEEKGEIEFTHYDLPEQDDTLTVRVEEITWYVE